MYKYIVSNNEFLSFWRKLSTGLELIQFESSVVKSAYQISLDFVNIFKNDSIVNVNDVEEKINALMCCILSIFNNQSILKHISNKLEETINYIKSSSFAYWYYQNDSNSYFIEKENYSINNNLHKICIVNKVVEITPHKFYKEIIK